MCPKFDKKEWAERYCKSIDLQELEHRLEESDYYRKKSWEERDFVRLCWWINLIGSFIIGTVLTLFVLTVAFASWVIPILILKAVFK